MSRPSLREDAIRDVAGGRLRVLRGAVSDDVRSESHGVVAAPVLLSCAAVPWTSHSDSSSPSSSLLSLSSLSSLSSSSSLCFFVVCSMKQTRIQ